MSEAALALASAVLHTTSGAEIDDRLRRSLAESSLTTDPVDGSFFFTSKQPELLLYHCYPAASSRARTFLRAVEIGPVQPGKYVLEAIPFSTKDHENIRKFVEAVAPVFLPRPQRAEAAIAVGNRHPEVSLPAAFEAFQTILSETGRNVASTVQLSATREMTTAAALAQRDGTNPTAPGHTRVSIEHLYHAGLWAAVRAGWRNGYSAEADHFIVSGATEAEIARSTEAAKVAIRAAHGFTKFTTDTARLFEIAADQRHPKAWTGSQVEERFRQMFSASEQLWILDAFVGNSPVDGVAWTADASCVQRLAVKFGSSLRLNEELYDEIRVAKNQPFDFEPSLDEAETLTTPVELYFYMQWLALRGRPAQLVPPNIGFKKRQPYPETLRELEKYAERKLWSELLPRAAAHFNNRPLDELRARTADLAAVARHCQGTLSIHSGSGKQAAVLEQIGKATAGRLNYKISGELQLQLFDVLAESAPDSQERRLFERMVRCAEQFAATGKFGEESALARQYANTNLGAAADGRAGANLFLVFWLGNVVGSIDESLPAGATRFFKDELDDLPLPVIQEAQRRNTNYITWLARNLW